MDEESVMVSFKLPTEVNAWIEAIAKKEMTTKSSVIRRFIAKELHKEEATQNVHSPDSPRDV